MTAPKAGKNSMSDEQRLSQVESDIDQLRSAMTTLTENVDKGFSGIKHEIAEMNKGFGGIKHEIAEGNKANLEKIGNVYGKMNTHALEEARQRNVSWPLIISIIAVIFLAASFFYTTINDRLDRTIQAERELRQSENEKTIIQSELNFTKKLLDSTLP